MSGTRVRGDRPFPGPDLLDLHRRTMERSIQTVDLAGDDDWELPTPCGGWRLRDLVAHMTADNLGFAAAAGGERTDRSAWDAGAVEGSSRAAYRSSAMAVVAAFNAPGLAGSFWLPRIDESVTFPAARAIDFHLLDYAIHTWDVGVSLGRTVDLPDDLVAAVLRVAHRDVPDGPRRLRAGAGFRPAVAVGPDGSAQDRLLAFLGRSPGWPDDRS